MIYGKLICVSVSCNTIEMALYCSRCGYRFGFALYDYHHYSCLDSVKNDFVMYCNHCGRKIRKNRILPYYVRLSRPEVSDLFLSYLKKNNPDNDNITYAKINRFSILDKTAVDPYEIDFSISCSKCGHYFLEDDVFCRSCGRRIIHNKIKPECSIDEFVKYFHMYMGRNRSIVEEVEKICEKQENQKEEKKISFFHRLFQKIRFKLIGRK